MLGSLLGAAVRIATLPLDVASAATEVVMDVDLSPLTDIRDGIADVFEDFDY